MHRLSRGTLAGAAVCGAAALFVTAAGPAIITSEARRPKPKALSVVRSVAGTAPTARENVGGSLPLLAGQWGAGKHKAPPEHLTWEPPAGTSSPAGESLKVTVTAEAAPSYASFMLHRTIDGAGIPDEDSRQQQILACGPGITRPGCLIVDNRNGSYSIEIVGAPPPDHPYRVLYVQWAPQRPGAEEAWSSWQLPLG